MPAPLAADAVAFLRECEEDWEEEAPGVVAALERRGVWESKDEWRISTVTTERIEADGDGYAIVSACAATWRTWMPTAEAAARAAAVLFSFHLELFYSLGWPSWAAANALDPREPGAEPRNDDAAPYLARLSDEALGRTGEPAGRVVSDADRYVARVVADPWAVASASPTRERAAQFQGVDEQLVADAAAWLSR